MKLLRKNLYYLLEKRETNPTALSNATGVPQPTIHRILTGASEDPRTSTLEPLAAHFGYTVEFLRSVDIELYDLQKSEKGGASDHATFEAAPSLRPFKNVPIVGTVEGGPEGYLEEAGYPVGHGDGHVEYPAKGKHAYALRVRGDSMRPRIKSGEFIIVEPDSPTHPGDDVVVLCKDGRKMVKELLYQRDGEITLGSINNGFKPITLPLEEVDSVQYVAAIVPRGAFYKPT